MHGKVSVQKKGKCIVHCHTATMNCSFYRLQLILNSPPGQSQSRSYACTIHTPAATLVDREADLIDPMHVRSGLDQQVVDVLVLASRCIERWRVAVVVWLILLVSDGAQHSLHNRSVAECRSLMNITVRGR